MSSKPNNSILLEAGTNELEILVFKLGNKRFGVNVAKVREVIEPLEVARIPQSHPNVLGVFQLRRTTLPLVDLSSSLGGQPHEDIQNGKIIVLEFNDTRIAFLVEGVEYIHRVKTTNIEAMPNTGEMDESPVTCIAHIDGQLVLMIDFEKIAFDIGGIDLFSQDAEKIEANAARGDHRILLADDSPVMRKLIKSNLELAGYTNIVACNDGEAAWRKLEDGISEQGQLPFDILITDIEMPKMDGLYLTRRIKDHSHLKDLPIVIFSSLVSVDNDKKCKSVGANAQITKPELAKLVGIVDGLVAGVPAMP